METAKFIIDMFGVAAFFALILYVIVSWLYDRIGWRRHRAFWRWVHEFTRRRLESFTRHTGAQKCGNCKRWTWEMTSPPTWSVDPNDEAVDIMECHACGHKSRWTMGPGLMLSLDEEPQNA